jgi:hypothetical protein
LSKRDISWTLDQKADAELGMIKSQQKSETEAFALEGDLIDGSDLDTNH